MNSLISYQQSYFENKLAYINSGSELLDLSMINPDLEPDREILDKLVEFALKNHTSRYAVSRGIRPLREAFSSKYRDTFGVAISAEEHICVTQGAKDALLSAFSALLKPADTVLLPRPTYPGHLVAAELTHLKCNYYDLSDQEDVLIGNICTAVRSCSPQMVLFNFPNNPTGLNVSPNFYPMLFSELRDSKAIWINDFVYGEMGFGNQKVSSSILASNPQMKGLLEIYSLSKSYSLPGWRVGSICGDAALIKLISKYKSHVDYGIFLPVQFAAAAALTSAKNITSEVVSVYQRRADFLLKELSRMGFQVKKPSGGCSLWVKLPDNLKVSAMEFCLDFMRDCGVAVTPGEFFEHRESRYFRVALVAGEHQLSSFIEKLRVYSQR